MARRLSADKRYMRPSTLDSPPSFGPRGPRRHWGAVIATLLAALALAALVNSLTRPTQAAAAASRPVSAHHPASAALPGLEVTGYQEASSPVHLIATDAAGLDGIGVDGVTLTASGRSVEATGPTALAQLRAAGAQQLPATLLVSNFSDAINDFSEPLAHRLLGSAAASSSVAATLARRVVTQHWQGISVDLESLTERDETGLTRFLTDLHRDLPAGSTLAIDVMNSTSAADYPATGYDLGAIAEQVTEVVLMAYDQHGSWENTPGPVGALAWQRAGVRAVLRSVPARELVLGVAGYGYAWEPHANIQVSDARARSIAAAAGVTPSFSAVAGEWSAALPDGTVLWWSDARSLALRAAMARQLHLRGLAIWDLQLSDPLS